MSVELHTAPAGPAPTVGAPSGPSPARIAGWLTWGSFIPVFGWLYAVQLLWSTPGIPARARWVGTLAPPGGWFGALLTGLWVMSESAGYETNDGPGGVMTYHQLGLLSPAQTWTLLGLLVLLGLLGPLYVRLEPARARLVDGPGGIRS